MGYYLDKTNINYTWNKCYEKCETCNYNGNDTNMNCLSCKSKLISKTMKQSIFFKLSSNNNCIQICPDNTFMTSEKDCVTSCPIGTFKYSLNNTCLHTCPNGISKSNNECIFKTFSQSTTLDDFKTQIMSNISAFVNSSKVINGSNFLAVILSSDNMNPEEQIKNGISAIDLGNCTEVLKEHFNISKEENLIIINMESKKDENKKNESSVNDKSFNLGKNIQLEIYDFSGRKLDLSVCKEDIKVMKYIGDVEELNIESAMSLADRGVDVFNAQDAFFNDICHPFDNADGIDIIIDDRRSDIYQNATFCEDGCTYTGMNYDLMVANCICDSSILQIETKNETDNGEKEISETLNFETVTKSFISNLFDFNIDVIYCYNLVINTKILMKNIGFYCLFGMFVLQIIFFIIYKVKKLTSLRYFMLIFDNKKDNTNKSNSNTINNINKSVKKIIKASPPKNNNSIITSLNDLEKSNKSLKHVKIKPKLQEKKRKLKLDLKSNEELVSKTKDKNNLSHSKKKMFSEFEEDLWDDFESDIQSNLNFPKISKRKKEQDREILFPQNFGPTINIQNPILNINNKHKKIKSILKKKTNLIGPRERELENSKKKQRAIIIDNKEDNDKIYNIKSTQHLPLQRIFTNKSGQSILKNINRMETIGDKSEDKKTNKNKDDDIIQLSKTDADLQDMDYEEAIIYDKRTYLRMYWAFLVDTQIILGTFCTDNYLNLMVIKLSFFICTFQISFFLNAFFYSDEYISDAYHNDGVLDFVSGLPKSIYSFIATLITTNLLKMLSNSKSELMKVIREKCKYNNYVRIINVKLNKLRKKLIVYFILVFLLESFFLYYVTAFCAVYRYSQKYWFYGCLESFAMDSLVALLVCIVLAFFRYISIKKHKKYFYILANIIGIFL